MLENEWRMSQSKICFECSVCAKELQGGEHSAPNWIDVVYELSGYESTIVSNCLSEPMEKTNLYKEL